ncbi:MAG: M28 family peptidase, partial [Bacteroidales bacterium]
MIKKLFFLPLIISILEGIIGCSGVKTDPDITEKDLYEHIHFLASDSLKGRYPGTTEDRVAAEYIAGAFKQSGLESIYNNGLQAFEIVTKIKTGANNVLKYQQEEFELNKSFVPLSFSASKKVEAEVVFAGYGFNIDEKAIKWNDYKDIDVRDQFVLLLRGEPEDKNNFALYSSLRSKAITAKDMGAAGVIFVSGPRFDANDELLQMDKPEGRLDIPVIQIKREIADKILSANNTTVKKLETELHQKQSPISFNTHKKIFLQTDIESDPKKTYNIVAGLINNENAKYIVIGAHYDHLGFGGLGTGSRNPNVNAIHYGADDNASGVASMLEIAQKLASKKDSLNTNFLFAAFGAEEMGLLGSKHFTNNLPVPDSLISAMINIDMVGR